MTAVSPVAQLILDVMAEHQRREGYPLTQAMIVKRGGLKKSRVSQLLNDPIKKLPDAEMLSAVARGLQVSEDRVLKAYLLAIGVNPAGRRAVPDRVQSALDRIEDGDFDDRTKAILKRAVYEDWERSNREPGDRRHAESGT